MPRAGQSRPDIITTLIAVCCVVVTIAVLRREFFPPPAALPGVIGQTPVAIDNWDALIATGDRIGPENASVTLLLFSDYECPACGLFANTTFPEIRDKYPDDVQLIYRHWPLSQHRLAYPAAVASDCASSQGRFEAFHELLYQRQDRIGLTTFDEFAQEAGVPDLKAFRDCLAVDGSESVDADIEVVRAMGGTGTPTLLVNGMLLRESLTPQVLDSAISAELARSK
jgi:protein-disulfide isomerase